MSQKRIRFVQTAPFGRLAKIEGSVALGREGFEFELAMVESVSGPHPNVIHRNVAYREIEEVRLKRRFVRRSRLIFLARNLEALNSIPGAKGYDYQVEVSSALEKVRSFIVDARLRIAQATMDGYSQQIEDSLA